MKRPFFSLPSDEIEIAPRARALLSASALKNNYEVISEQLKGQGVIPMIKANAYGHGAVWATQVLKTLPHLYGWGVASLEEGKEVREGLGLKFRKNKILVFSGAIPWSEEKGQYCEQNGLTPVIGSDEDWAKFFKGQWHRKLPYHLKFNTGMNRLGISTSQVNSIVKQLENEPIESRPEGVASHLALAENPSHPLTQQQIARFTELRGRLESVWGGVLFHLANSSGIWNQKHFGLAQLTDIIRPGISLYGVPPWPGAPERGLKPVMELEYQVMARRKLQKNDCVGYGATFKCEVAQQEVAILSAGYADGFHRMMSNRGEVWASGKLRKVLGIISMDLAAIECDASIKVGSWAKVLGTELDPWTQAHAAGTIPYELLTSVSNRVKKVNLE
jgi:alanine racemase